MTRLEALKEAEASADRLIGEVPLNARGYPVDGYRRPTTEERASIVLRIAAFLVEEGDE